jgi:hypothetical protein
MDRGSPGPIERTSTKHGPRLDDTLEAEDRPFTTGAPVDPHTREEREKDLLDDEIPDPSARPAGTADAAVNEEERHVREALAEAIAGAPYPCDRNALIRYLGDADQRSDLVARLRVLPADHVYGGVAEVLQGLAGWAQ